MKKALATILILTMLLSVMPIIAVQGEEVGYCMNLDITSVNGERVAVSVVVYTPDHGETTGSAGNGAEYVVDSNGIITAINKSNSNIPSDGFVLSVGPAKKADLASVKVGDTVMFDDVYSSVTVVSADYTPFVSETIAYDGVNVIRSADKLIIYRGKETSETNTWGYEACVDANGTIVSVGGNNNAIPEGGYVISGVGVKKPVVEAVCKLGYGATLDEVAKTITVSYTKENAASGFKLRLDNAIVTYNEAYMSYADVDIDSAKTAIEALDAIYADIQSALSSDDVFEFLKLSNSFDKAYALLEVALIPYVPVEARTLWLRIPTKSDDKTVESVVDEIVEMGFNSVCIEILFDSTTIMPMPEDSLFEQNPAFGGKDMLAAYIERFHEEGVEVVAWMSCYRVGHDASANVARSVGKKKPEWLNTDQNGGTTVSNEYGNAYFLNPALPEVKEFLLESYKYILENYHIDGFQLDYVRYPENSTVNFGYDEYTKQLFLEEYGFSSVPTSSSQAGWEEWCKFRASFVTDLVKSVRAMIDEIRPDVWLSCDVAPDYPSSISKMCQDTVTWLEEGIVDVVYPMAYGTTDAVEKWTNMTLDASADNVFAIIGLRDNGAKTYIEQILKARECGASGSAFFSYSQYIVGGYGEVAETVFAKPAVNPNYNAKNAIIAMLDHMYGTITVRIKSVVDETDSKTDVSKLLDYAEELKTLSYELSESEVEAMKSKIDETVTKGIALVADYESGDECARNAALYLKKSLADLKKISDYSKDSEKANLAIGGEDEEQSADVSDDVPVNENNGFEKAIQAVSIVILAIGFLGLPAYLWLNARGKGSEASAGDEDDDPDPDESEESEQKKR